MTGACGALKSKGKYAIVTEGDVATVDAEGVVVFVPFPKKTFAHLSLKEAILKHFKTIDYSATLFQYNRLYNLCIETNFLKQYAVSK